MTPPCLRNKRSHHHQFFLVETVPASTQQPAFDIAGTCFSEIGETYLVIRGML